MLRAAMFWWWLYCWASWFAGYLEFYVSCGRVRLEEILWYLLLILPVVQTWPILRLKDLMLKSGILWYYPFFRLNRGLNIAISKLWPQLGTGTVGLRCLIFHFQQVNVLIANCWKVESLRYFSQQPLLLTWSRVLKIL